MDQRFVEYWTVRFLDTVNSSPKSDCTAIAYYGAYIYAGLAATV
jgi:hypothetical protein